MERYESIYHGFRLIADHWKGKHQGRAYFGLSPQIHKSKTLSASGESIEDVVKQLKSCVDLFNLQENRGHANLHIEYLASIGKVFIGYVGEMPRKLPEWHCYLCHSKFNEFQGLRCTGCGAEVCPNCGACHCGYQGIYKYS